MLTGGALLSLPCVRGGAARSAAEGLFLTETLFLFCSAISKLLQSLRRCRASSLYTREPFSCLCEHCKKVLLFPQGGGIWNAPYGIRFCRSSRRQMVAPVVCTLYLRRWRRLPTATHIRPRQRKDTFFTLSNTLPAFSLVAPGAKKKLSKRNAKGRRVKGDF